MTVYVLTSYYIDVDSGDYDSEVIGVYENFDDAEKFFKENVKQAKANFKNYVFDETEFFDGDMYYEIWEREYQMSHRLAIEIKECEIQ